MIVQVPVLTGAVQSKVQWPVASAVVWPLPDFSIAIVTTAPGQRRPRDRETERPRRNSGWSSLMVIARFARTRRSR